MAVTDDILYEVMLKIENKDIFVDLKRNKSGTYLKISERNGTARNTVLIPASGIPRLKRVLDDVQAASARTKSVSNERRNRVANDPEITARSVYVTGLTWDTNDTELADHFRQAGVVVSSSILRQRRGSPAKSSLGCGVVEFASRDMALHACQVLNLTELKGRPIRCREDRHPDTDDRYRGDNDEDGGGDDDYGSGDLDDVGTSPAGSRRSGPPRDRHRPSRGPPAGGGPKVADPTRVFVTNLAWDATDADVRQHFSAIGPVASATVLSSRKGRSMGSGVVEYVDPASVQEAISRLGNTDFNGRVIVVREYFQ